MRINLGWKTIGGAVLWGVGQLGSPEVLAAIPPKWASVFSTVGAVLAVIGGRHALAKAQPK